MSDGDRIITAEDGYYMDPAIAPAACGPLQHWHRSEAPAVPADKDIAGAPIAVYANHGRWIAECPGCRGAQYASRTDHRFFCLDCLNVWNGGKWAPTSWPAPAALAQIETILLDRSERSNRHWLPGETAADLRAENAANPHMLVGAVPSLGR